MSSEDKILQEGYITSARGNGFFMVEITHENGNAQQILCKLSGKMRKNNIRVLEEDFVKIEISPYDLTKGVITFRRR